MTLNANEPQKSSHEYPQSHDALSKRSHNVATSFQNKLNVIPAKLMSPHPFVENCSNSKLIEAVCH